MELSDLTIELLDKRVHDRRGFSCGVAPLDEYLKKHANQNQRDNISKTFVAYKKNCSINPKAIQGYYTLSSGHITWDKLPDKIKSALREHKITLTNDYTEADLIVTHDNISQSCEHGENIPSTKMMVRLWNYETTSGCSSSTTSINSLITNSVQDVIVTKKITDSMRYYSLNIEDSLYDKWLITGLAVNIAYLIDTGAVTTVDCETVLHASASKMELTEELVEQIKSMVYAGGDDKEMAASIIPNIDYNKNHHLLWKLSQDCNAITYDFNRNKDIQYWLDKSNFGDFYHKNAQDMIQWLEEKNLLTKVSFRYLEPICRREIHISNRDLYVFQVSVKKEYKKYLV